ncbi:hypothetical protein [Natrinema amylolyticum]|uniref:hypothetical protein n=1 Tax=Natrinema amylolyticum TaxID=2878679 RepID=UPI001CFB77FC|nr:hypothetical protein [Natrinema amylolyticum]
MRPDILSAGGVSRSRPSPAGSGEGERDEREVADAHGGRARADGRPDRPRGGSVATERGGRVGTG